MTFLASRCACLMAVACLVELFSCSAGAPLSDRNGQETSGRKLDLPWIRRLSTNRSAIVFVHGVTGSASETWANGDKYWPSMLTADPTFDGQNIYVYSYPSPRFTQTFSVDDVAENLRLVLKTDGVLRHEHLSFVSHSMGGLVTRAFLTKYQREIAPKVRLLFFFGTPTTGSPYATLAGLISKNPQFRQMYPMNPDSYLGKFQSDWLAARLNLRSYCAFETQTIFGQLIVERPSATNLCTEPLDPIDANHITMVKPDSERSTAYRALKEAFEDTSNPSQPRSMSHSTEGLGAATSGARADASNASGPTNGTKSEEGKSTNEQSSNSKPTEPTRTRDTQRSLPQRIVIDYEDLSSRFDAVEKSLRERMRDLNGAQPKPEIVSDLATCRKDLIAAKVAMDAGDVEVITVRLDRARRTIVRLESL